MLQRTTPSLQFFKSHKKLSNWNPLKRWVYHKLFATIVVGSGTMMYASYRYAGTRSVDQESIGSSTSQQVMEFLPFNFLSALAGSVASTPLLSAEWHQRLIDWYVWWYQVNLHEANPSRVEDYPTLESFFVRDLKEGAREVDRSSRLVCPCDGVVLQAGTAHGLTNNWMVQVKGTSFTFQNLLRSSLPPLAQGMSRRYAVIHLRAQDYHHVHSPCDITLTETVHVAGTLYPVTRSGFSWIPNILTQNERVCVAGRQHNHNSAAVRGSSYPPPNDNIWIALVGGTLMGKIDLKFDARIRTNQSDAPDYAVHRVYRPGEKEDLKRGVDFARFRWGSAVVVIADVPSDEQFVVKPGDVVSLGQPLLTKNSS